MPGGRARPWRAVVIAAWQSPSPKEEQQELEHWVRSGTMPAGKVRRARIILLLAHPFNGSSKSVAKVMAAAPLALAA